MFDKVREQKSDYRVHRVAAQMSIDSHKCSGCSGCVLCMQVGRFVTLTGLSAAHMLAELTLHASESSRSFIVLPPYLERRNDAIQGIQKSLHCSLNAYSLSFRGLVNYRKIF